MTKVKQNSRVAVAYRVSAKDGTVLEAVTADAPAELRLGDGDWPILLELALIGQSVGDMVKVEILAKDKLFGHPDPERVQRLPLTDFTDQKPAVGQLIEFSLPSGEPLEGLVTALSDTEVEVDFNHPYVGRDLNFEVSIVEVL